MDKRVTPDDRAERGSARELDELLEEIRVAYREAIARRPAVTVRIVVTTEPFEYRRGPYG